MVRRTYGGKLLKELREQRGWTQLEVQLKKVIAQKTLSKIETGRTLIPDRDTLRTLLDFYNATFNEAHEIMKAFGYLPDTSFLPTEADIAGVLEHVRPILNTAPVPVYVIDFIARLYGYSDLFLSLSGLEHEEMRAMEGIPIWQSWLESGTPSDGVLDADVLVEFRAMQQSMMIYVGEPWFDAFIEERGEPFLTYWRAAENSQEVDVSSLEFSLFRQFRFYAPGTSQPLHFYINEEMVEHDQRFRQVLMMPADAITWQWVETHRQAE